MATRTDIANYALIMVGEQVAVDITNEDEGQHAVWANRLYDQTKLEVLRSHNWGCARKRVELAEEASAPVFGYENAFSLPSDFVRAVSYNDVDPDDVDKPVVERMRDTLATDEATLKLDYIANVDDGLLDPLCVEAIYTLLASKLAWAIQQNRTMREELMAQYRNVLTHAKFVASTETRKALPSRRRQSGWIDARYSSTNG